MNEAQKMIPRRDQARDQAPKDGHKAKESGMKQPCVIFVFYIVLSIPSVLWASAVSGNTEGMAIYPSWPSIHGPVNTRIPWVMPEAGGALGKCLNVEGSGSHVRMLFRYSLGLIRFENGGKLSGAFRDTPSCIPKSLLILSSAKNETLSLDFLGIDKSSGVDQKGRIRMEFRSAVGGPINVSVETEQPMGLTWKPYLLIWDKSGARLECEGKPIALLVFQRPFSPSQVALNPIHVDEMTIEGNGKLFLGWEDGYAAKLFPEADNRAVTARMMGFDAMVVSQDPLQRDYPMVQVLNACGEERQVDFFFAISSELRRTSNTWQQAVKVPPRSGIMLAVRFPFLLQTDVYHMQIKSAGLTEAMETEAHFMFVKRRLEPAGPDKFALHAYGGETFGYWPDSLPVKRQHLYVQWASEIGKDHNVQRWPTNFNWDQAWVEEWCSPEAWNWNYALEWYLKANIPVYVSISGAPLYPWMREREYDEKDLKEERVRTKKRGGYEADGRTKMEAYRQFVREFARKHKGQIKFYEVENEPDAPHFRPEDYVDMLRIVYEETHAADADVRVHGLTLCVPISTFYSDKVFKLGGNQYMDAVSWHTYTTGTTWMPRLYQSLQRLKSLAASLGIKRVVNSETGESVARRERVDQPIAPDRLQLLVDHNIQPWPQKQFGSVVDEWLGARNMVQNVVYNFLAGAEMFTFYGWEIAPPPDRYWDCLSIFSRAKAGGPEGTPTPSLYSLAMGVITAQLEGMIPGTGTLVDQDSVRGAIFKKQNGGELAVLWANNGQQTTYLQYPGETLEKVSIFGEGGEMRTVPLGKERCCSVDLSGEPVYIHARESGMKLFPSLIKNVTSSVADSRAMRIRFDLRNPFDHVWSGTVELQAGAGWEIKPGTIPFEMAASGTIQMESLCFVPEGLKRGGQMVTASVKISGGHESDGTARGGNKPSDEMPESGIFRFSIPIQVPPVFFDSPVTP